MRLYPYFAFAAALIVAAALSLGQAQAQSGAACPIGAPVTKADTTYTLTSNDQCLALVFTNKLGATVTLPAITRVPQGFQVMLISTGGGIVLNTVSTSAFKTGAIQAALGQGQSAVLYGDGTNYELGIGQGFVTKAPPGVNFSNYASVIPGTTSSNSEVSQFPDAVLQYTNRASWPIFSNPRSSYFFSDICKTLPFVDGPIAPGRTQFIRILDPLGRSRLIPVCG